MVRAWGVIMNIEKLRAEVEALKAAKNRLLQCHMDLVKVNRLRRRRKAAEAKTLKEQEVTWNTTL